MSVPPLLLLRKLILCSSLCELYRTSMLGTYVCMSGSVGFKPQTDQEVQFKSCSISGIKAAFFTNTSSTCATLSGWGTSSPFPPATHRRGLHTVWIQGLYCAQQATFCWNAATSPFIGVNTDVAILSKIKDHKGDGLQAPPLIKLMQKDEKF